MKKIIISLLSIFILSFSFWINKSFSAEAQCSWADSLCSSDYMIDTQSLWLWWTEINTGWTAKDTIENWLEIIVNKLMIAFWVLTLFIMTIGWWYMIFAHGQDELLNKWKSIFNAWLIALIVALSSWIIMKFVISLLY